MRQKVRPEPRLQSRKCSYSLGTGSASHSNSEVATTAPQSFAPAAQLFRALADSTRLRLLNLMAEQEVCVCYFTEVIGAPQPKISRHLAYLRAAGPVAARREGKWVHCRLVTPSDLYAAEILGRTLAAVRQDANLKRDLQELEKACCGPRSLAQLLGAPLPSEIGK